MAWCACLKMNRALLDTVEVLRGNLNPRNGESEEPEKSDDQVAETEKPACLNARIMSEIPDPYEWYCMRYGLEDN